MNALITGAYILGVAVGLIGYHWLTAPGRHRIQARAETVLRAAATVRQERDELEELSESQGSLIAAYRRANDRLFECLKDHMEADEWAAIDPGLTVYDRLVTDVLDRETWGGTL